MSAEHTHGDVTMTDTARRLRAQKAYSTDPAYLERMAREEETRGVGSTNDATAFACYPNARAAVQDRPNE